MDIHVRTTLVENAWSYIEAVAVRFGDFIIEFDEKQVVLDGVEIDDPTIPFLVGDKYLVTHSTDKGRLYYNIHIDQDTILMIRFYDNLSTVNLQSTATRFKTSSGILGEYGTGIMYNRNGVVMEDFGEFAIQWQVNPDDPVLFRAAREPQLPYEKCRMPAGGTVQRRRRLRHANRKLLEQAEAACAVYGDDMMLCIDDVMLTGNIEMAQEFAGAW